MKEESISRVTGTFDDDLFVQMLEVLPVGHSFIFIDIRSWKKENYDRVIKAMKDSGYEVYEDELGFDEDDYDINYMMIIKEYRDSIKSNDVFRIRFYTSLTSIRNFMLTDYLAMINF